MTKTLKIGREYGETCNRIHENYRPRFPDRAPCQGMMLQLMGYTACEICNGIGGEDDSIFDEPEATPFSGETQ